MAIPLRLAGAAACIAWLGVGNAAPDPLDPTAPVAAPVHRSVFDTYRRHDEAKPVPWWHANDTVERIGGWRSYAREANVPTPAGSAPQAMPQPAPRTEPARPAGGHKH